MMGAKRAAPKWFRNQRRAVICRRPVPTTPDRSGQNSGCRIADRLAMAHDYGAHRSSCRQAQENRRLAVLLQCNGSISSVSPASVRVVQITGCLAVANDYERSHRSTAAVADANTHRRVLRTNAVCINSGLARASTVSIFACTGVCNGGRE